MSFLINPARFAAAGGGGGGPWSATLTIASGKVASNLTDYPLYVDLADMPSGFWAATNGEDIRAFVGALQVPCDIAWCDPLTQTGALVVKVPTVNAASATAITLQGNGSDSLPAVTDTYGRNAVWSDYHAVFLLGITGGDDRTGLHDHEIHGDPDCFEKIATSSTDLNSHQGVCWDGAHYYTVDTNAIYKWDSTWTLVASNADPIGAAAIAGSPAVNHCGDPDVRGGRLYIPIECYPASGGLYNAHIAVFDPSDLSFIESFDISAQAHEASSICYCDKDGLLYVSDYDAHFTTLFKYSPTDGSYIGTLTLSKSCPNIQGVTWWRNYFWVSQDANDETIRVAYDGTCSHGDLSGGAGGLGFGTGVSGGNYEGIGHRDDALLQTIDPGTGTERVEVWSPLSIAKGAGGGLSTPGTKANDIRGLGLTSLSTYTLGATVAWADKSQNRTPISYVDTTAAGSTNTRQVIAYHSATPSIGIWDKNNGWLDCSPAINPTLNQSYRIHAVYQGTTSRKVYVDGTLKNTQSTISALPSTLNQLWMGGEDSDYLEGFIGKIGFVYLRGSALGADWIAAEHSNLNAPSSFYSIT